REARHLTDAIFVAHRAERNPAPPFRLPRMSGARLHACTGSGDSCAVLPRTPDHNDFTFLTHIGRQKDELVIAWPFLSAGGGSPRSGQEHRRGMERVGFFLAGFASGWAVRTTVDSSRALAVNVVATFYRVVDGASRIVGMEREHLEDLLAEARAKYEM